MTDTPVIARPDAGVKRYDWLSALDGFSLRAHRGKLQALLGPNGAGKSTAIALMLGLIRPDAGTVESFGFDSQRTKARRRIGVMLQDAPPPPTLRVGQSLRLTASYYPAPRSVREAAELADVVNLLKRPYAKLSGGQQRRVQFALALIGQPELLFLDEPTVGLDIASRQKLWSTIRQLVADGCAVLLNTHYLEEAESLADRACVMAHGRMIHEGIVDSLRARMAIKRIRCLSTLDIDQVRGWQQVAEVQCDGDRLLIATQAAENVLRQLLQAEHQLSELEVQRAGLAEAFSELTRDADAISPDDRREAA